MITTDLCSPARCRVIENFSLLECAVLLCSGADCMGLMARAARMAARQGREAITEEDIYAAMENKAMEAYQV